VSHKRFETNLDFGEVELKLEDVLAVQSLAMNIREHARRVRTGDPRAHRYVILDNCGQMLGGTDTYFGVSVSKPSFRQWRMRVSFLENIFEEEQWHANYREVYAFDWNNKTCLGEKRTVERRYAPPQAADMAGGVYVMGEYVEEPGTGITRYPLSSADCGDLRQRMAEFCRTREELV